MNDFMNFITGNFWHVAPILIAGVLGIAIIAERGRALYVTYPIHAIQDFYALLQEMVLTDRMAEAVALCDRYKDKPVAMIAKEGLLRAHQPESLIQNGIELAMGDAAQRIQKRTTYLATIANVATLLGLFGTIAGLIASFEAVGQADAQQKSALLAAGISTAMNATMLGLAVAIPCMVAFSILANKTNRLVSELDHAGVRILDLIKQRSFGVDVRNVGPSHHEKSARAS